MIICLTFSRGVPLSSPTKVKRTLLPDNVISMNSIFYPPTVEPGLFIMPIQRQTNSGYRSAKCRVEDLVPTKDKTIELQNADAFQLHALYVLHRL